MSYSTWTASSDSIGSAGQLREVTIELRTNVTNVVLRALKVGEVIICRQRRWRTEGKM